jgi:hypothetical protein
MHNPKLGAVPERRLRRVNVVFFIAVACVGRKEGKKGGNGGWVGDLKVGLLNLSMGPARAEVRSYIQKATISGKKVIYTLNIHKKHRTCNSLI